MQNLRIVVSIPGEADYDVRIGQEVLAGLGEQLRACPATAQASQVLVITDANVERLYLPQAMEALRDAGYEAANLVVPAGEDSKSLDVAGEVWNAMASVGLTRDSVVVALGGGVVGDLAGFTASTFMRGIPVVQAPTTLLSMVDSSVGGKTAVNLEAGKNMVGTFCQPAYVCADISTLSTLDEREWTCGLAEAAKSAVIDSDEFFFWMTDQAQDLFARKPEAVAEVVKRCVVFKASVVAEDKTESKGVRECLNYGHTLAHAIETLAGYGTFSHGAAVAEGMRFAAYLSERLIGAEPDFVQAQSALLDALGLPYLDWTADPHDILVAMKHDKKARAGKVRFVLMRDVGAWDLVAVDDADVLDALAGYFSQTADERGRA